MYPARGFLFIALAFLIFLDVRMTRADEPKPVPPQPPAKQPPAQQPPKKLPPTGKAAEWLKALDGTDSTARTKALDGLLTLVQPPHEALPAVRKLVNDGDLGTKTRGALLVWLLDKSAEPDWKQLRDAIKSDDNALCLTMVNTLNRAEAVRLAAAIPVFMEGAVHSDPQVAQRAFSSLSSAVILNYDALVKGLDDDKPAIQAAVLRALALYTPLHEKSLPFARPKLKSPHAAVRVDAVRTVWRLSRNFEEITPTLLGLLVEKDTAIAKQAFMFVLGLIPPPKDAAKFYQATLKFDDLEIRVHSARALLEIGGSDPDIIGIVRKALAKDALCPPAFRAISLMDAKTAKELLPDMMAVVEKGRAGDVNRLNGAFAAFQVVAADAAPRLIQLIERDPSQYGSMVGSILGATGESGVKEIKERLPKVEKRVRFVLFQALGSMGKSAVPLLVPYIAADQDLSERTVTINCLARLGFHARDAVPALKKCLNDKNESVRQSALQAIINAFPSGTEVRDVLAKAVNDSSPRIRFLAAENLLWIDPSPQLLFPIFEDMDKNEAQSYSFWLRFSELNAADCASLLPLALPAVKGTQRTVVVLTLVAKHSVYLKGQLEPYRELLEEYMADALKNNGPKNNRPPVPNPNDMNVTVGEVAWALGGHDDATIKRLTELIEKQPNGRAYDLLSRYGPKAKAAIPALEKWAKVPPSGLSVTQGCTPHVAIVRIDPERQKEMLAVIPATPEYAHHRLAIDPKDEAALKALRALFAKDYVPIPNFYALSGLNPPPVELRDALEAVLERYMKLPVDQQLDPFQIGGSPNISLYRAEVAYTLWRVTGDSKKTVPILLDLLNNGPRPWEIYDRFARMGPAARDAIPELLRRELNQKYPNLTLFRMAFTIDRNTAMKVDLSKR